MNPELSAETGRSESVAPSTNLKDRRGLSLRARLLTGMALVVLALGVVGVIVTQTTRAELVSQIDTRLEAAGGGDRYPGANMPRPPGGFDDWLSDVYEGVLEPNGQLLTLSLIHI